MKRQEILQRKKANGQMRQAGGLQPGGASKLNLIETEKRTGSGLVSSFDTKLDLKTATVSLGR